MKIAKTNISYQNYYFDAGSEVIAPDNIMHEIAGLLMDVPDKESPVKKPTVKEEVKEETKEKLMKTDVLKDKKLGKYKNK